MSAPVLAALSASEPSIGSSLLHMVLALGAVIVAILVVQKVLVAIRGGSGAPRRRLSGQSHRGLQILARQNLGKGVQLAVVRYGEREVLVGVTGQQISFFEADPPARAVEVESAFDSPLDTGSQTGGNNASLSAIEELLRRRPNLASSLALDGPSASASSLIERLRAVTERH